MTVISKSLMLAACSALLLSAPMLDVAAEDTVSIQLPPETAVYKEGPGQELATSRCMICHSADYVYMQPPLPKDKWVGVVNKMVKVFGCPIDEKDVDALAGYLASQNGK